MRQYVLFDLLGRLLYGQPYFCTKVSTIGWRVIRERSRQTAAQHAVRKHNTIGQSFMHTSSFLFTLSRRFQIAL